MSRAIVFTGLVRDEGRFAAILDAIEEARKVYDLPIVYSTWFGELSRYPDLQLRLVKMGVHVVEQDQPTLVLPGHILHQIACIDLGLSVLDDDCFVLKLRPDISNVGDVFDFLAVAPEPGPQERLMPSPFSNKFHVRGVFGAHPFYINDITIAGQAADLRRLCRVPFLSLIRYWRLAPEQILWASHFIQDIPVLDAYFRSNIGLVFDNQEAFNKLRQILTEDPLFAEAIACSAMVFQENFVFLGPDPLRMTAGEVAGQLTLESLFWDAVAIPHLAPHPTCFTNSFRTAGLMTAVAEGHYKSSPLGERVARAMAAYALPGAIEAQRRRAEELHADALRLGERLEQETGVMGMKALRDAPSHRWVRGAKPHWSIDGGNRDRADELAAEVNVLRRTIDGLNDRLRRSGG